MKKIPIFKAKVNTEDEGILCMSIVDCPANEREALLFKKESVAFKVEDEEKRLMFGLVMPADTPIYRRKGDFEYYITYEASTLAEMAEKFLSSGNYQNVDVQHNGKLVNGVNLVEWFIKDSSKGIVPKGFEDIPDGSIFATYKVENDEIWEALKSGELEGFSLAGLFELEPTDEQIIQYNKETKKKFYMSKVRKALKALLQEFMNVETDKGTIIVEDIKVGVDALDENDEPIADGEYKTEKQVIVIAEGKITEIREIEEPTEEEPKEDSAEFAAFKAQIEKFETSYNDIFRAIADAVYASGEECAYVMDAGDDFAIVDIYTEGEGDKLYRYSYTMDENGKVTLGERVEVRIKSEYVPVDAPAEEPKTEEEQPAESGDTQEFAEEEQPAEEPKTEEEQPAEEPKEDAEMEALKAEIEAMKAEIEALKTGLAAISNEPAKENVAEEFHNANISKTGNAKLDNLSRLMGISK